MIVQKRGDVSIYNLTSGPSLPEWISERARRNLNKKDAGIRRRIELLQDFDMPASSSRIRQSADGRYLIAAGTYPPRVRCYDTEELGMKFERYETSGIIDVCMLGNDYGKFCLLLDNRNITFHAPYGTHETVRIPTFGRALAYESTTCELLIAASGNAVYRMNLEEGRFNIPWEIDSSNDSLSSISTRSFSCSCIGTHPMHPLAVLGGEDGYVRLWDSRMSDNVRPFLRLDVASALAASGVASYGSGSLSPEDSTASGSTHYPEEITSLTFDHSAGSNGMQMALGTAAGLVAVYDLRSSRPVHVMAHKAGLPIHTVDFHSSQLLLSSDAKLIQGTSLSSIDGKAPVSSSSSPLSMPSAATNSTSTTTAKFHIEAASRFTHFIVAAKGDHSSSSTTANNGNSSSGLILCTSDQPRMEAFYVPQLGVAPRWCSFLENITEELTERDLARNTNSDDPTTSSSSLLSRQEVIYDNYTFVSREEVEKLEIGHLIGTPLLRGYMHGFFMDSNMHKRIQSIVNPFEYEQYQKQKLKERIDSKSASRIAPRNNNTSSINKNKNKTTGSTLVNANLAYRLKNAVPKSANKKSSGRDLLNDDRFGSLFTNRNFEIDEESENFKLRNPSGVALARERKDNVDSDEDDEGIDETQEQQQQYQHRPSASERDDDDDRSDATASDSSATDDAIMFKGVQIRGEEYDAVKALSRRKMSMMKANEESQINPSRATISNKKRKGVQLMESNGNYDRNAVRFGLGRYDATQRAKQRLEQLNIPIAQRLQQQQQGDNGNPSNVRVRVTDRGSKEATYIPNGKATNATTNLSQNRSAKSKQRHS